MGSSGARWLRLTLGFAATAGFAWLLARELHLETLGRAFAGLSASMLMLALSFLAAGIALRILRWWWMLRVLEPDLPLGACIRPFLVGLGVNNVLPLRAGDALRVFGYCRQLRSPAMRVAGTLVIERTLDVGVLLGVFLLGLLGLPELSDDASAGGFPHGFVVTATWLAGLGLVAVLVLLLAPALRRLRCGWGRRRFFAARRWPEVVSGHGAHLIEALGLVRSPARMLVLIGLSVVAWACEGVVFVAVAGAVHAGAAPPGPWFSLATGTLATMLPSAPGHLGTFDYFAAQGLAAYGAPGEAAAAFALTVHAVLWAPVTAAGLLCLLAWRRPVQPPAAVNTEAPNA